MLFRSFAAPAAGTYGDLKENSLVGPGTFNVDMGLSRSFKAGKEREFQFRAEIFNLLNHTQLQNPVTALTASNFGFITAAYDPRIIQLAVKFGF